MSTPFHRAAVHLRHAGSVAIGVHMNPDGDALGSSLGLTLALRDIGIPAVPVLPDGGLPTIYSFLPGYQLFVPAEEIEQPDTFVAIDTPSLQRLGSAEGLAQGAQTVIDIDHHPDNACFGTVNLVESSASASGELVWRLLERLEVDVSPEVAMCLYVAVLTDTGRFQYQNTTAETLRYAAAMLEVGVSPSDVAQLVYQNRSCEVLAIQGRVLERITLANDGRVAYSWVTGDDFEETGALRADTENLVDTVRVLGGVDVVALLRAENGQVRVNLRSKGSFDVGSTARDFGGGGHTGASGFSVEGTIEEILPALLAKLPGGRS